MLAGIHDILLITTLHEQEAFTRLLGDGQWLGLNIRYAAQARPEGIAQAFIIGQEFIAQDPVGLILSDNIFYGHGLPELLQAAANQTEGATIFAYQVRDPERYGVVEFDPQGRAVSLAEKPPASRSNYAVTGLYFYDNQVVDIATQLRPSPRGELEITDVNLVYLQRHALYVEKLGRGVAWLDTGTHESLLQAANFIHALQERQGLMVSCVEEIAYTMDYITAEDVAERAETMKSNEYGQYLFRMIA
jgi:glucose-1-phosphate thymidylyltransferase